MPDGGPDTLIAFRELVHELRGVGEALCVVLERTARLEVKVDGLASASAANAGVADRVAELESWFRSEMAARNARGHMRALWIGVLATLAGGAAGSIVGHLWK